MVPEYSEVAVGRMDVRQGGIFGGVGVKKFGRLFGKNFRVSEN